MTREELLRKYSKGEGGSLSRASLLEKYADREPSMADQTAERPKPGQGDLPSMVKADPSLTEMAVHGATAGGSDELLAALNTPNVMLRNYVTGQGETDPRKVYERELLQRRATIDATRKKYPWLAPAAEVAGGLATGAGRGVTQGANFATRAARGAIEGGLYGGAYGFNTGENMDQRLEQAGEGAVAGGITGVALPPLMEGASALTRAAIAPFRAVTPERTAARMVAQALERDSMSPGRTAARLDIAQVSKPVTVTADIGGRNTQSLLRAAANVPGRNRDALVRGLESRQEGQLDRLTNDIGLAMGDPRQFTQTTEALINQRRANAQPLWDQAYRTATPYTRRLQEVLERPLAQRLVDKAEQAALNRGETFSGMAFRPRQPSQFERAFPTGQAPQRQRIQVPGTQDIHRVRMQLNEAINQLERRQESGLGNVTIRDLTILKRDLDNAIQNPAFHRAVRAFADDSTAINALDRGFNEGMSMEPEAIQAALRGMSPPDRALFRLGMARAIANSLRDTGRVGTNRADILASPKYATRMAVAFPNAAARREFALSLGLEQRMARTRQAVQGNSTTPAQLAEGENAAADSGQAILSGVLNLARGNYLSAALNFISRMGRHLQGLGPDVADQIIRLLASGRSQDMRAAQRLVTEAQGRLRRRGNLGRGLEGAVTGSAAVTGTQAVSRQAGEPSPGIGNELSAAAASMLPPLGVLPRDQTDLTPEAAMFGIRG